MGFLFIIGLLLHSPAEAAPCTRVDIPIEGAQRVSFDHGSRLVKLYYRVESCGTYDIVSLIEADVRDESEVKQTAFRGRIDTIYRPANVERAVFNKLPRRIHLVEDDDYRIRGGGKLGESGGLRFHAKGQLHIASVDRESEERAQSALQSRSPELGLRSRALRFAPFRVQRLSVECPTNRGLRLARTEPFWVGGQRYALWTLRTREGYEMTELLELESRRSVQLVKAFVADAQGKFLLGMPVPDGDYLNFDDIERDIYLPKFELDEQFPLSKEEWLSRIPIDNRSPLAVTFTDTAESESLQEMRNLLTEVIPRELILNEWKQLLTDRKLHSLWKDGRTAYVSGVEWISDLVYRSVPELSRAASSREELRQTVRAFSEGMSLLFVGSAINEAQLQTLLESPKIEEAKCMRMLKGFAAKRDLPRELTEAMRKVSFNLSILRSTLARLRNGEK